MCGFAEVELLVPCRYCGAKIEKCLTGLCNSCWEAARHVRSEVGRDAIRRALLEEGFDLILRGPIRCGYAVLTLTDRHFVDRPVGVAAWDVTKGWWKVAVNPACENPLAAMAAEELRAWAAEASTPYSHDHLEPWTSRFWDSAARCLGAAVRLGPRHAMQPSDDPESAFQALLKSVTGKQVYETYQESHDLLHRFWIHRNVTMDGDKMEEVLREIDRRFRTPGEDDDVGWGRPTNEELGGGDG